jgi:BMFP domain-containing protein YqiC
VSASEIGLDEVARHEFDATTEAVTRKRQNVWTLPRRAQRSRRESSVRDRTPSLA